MKTHVTVYVEKWKTEDKYQVVRVKNSLKPAVGETLTADQVQEMIASGTEVVFDLLRPRR